MVFRNDNNHSGDDEIDAKAISLVAEIESLLYRAAGSHETLDGNLSLRWVKSKNKSLKVFKTIGRGVS